MDIKKYEALQKIIEFGSFSRAATELGYTQSAVSQMVSSMEDELGLRLVDRTRAGVRLTPEGRRLFPLIERVIDQQRGVMQAVDEINGLDNGVVRIGSLTCISNCWLPTLMCDFEAKYPNVHFEIKQGDYASVAEWVRTGSVDFGFVNPAAVNGLETKPIKEGPMLAVLPPDHPLASNEVIDLHDLAEEPFVLLEEGNYYEPLEAFGKEGVQPKVRYRIHDAFAIMAMVQQGLGVSILAKMLLAHQNYDIVQRPTSPEIMRPISVAYRDWSSLPIASRRFIENMQAQAQTLE
jgi:DNA-binding transcriptional LysR family regulator